VLPQGSIRMAAEATGVNSSTLRLWERWGVLAPQRTPKGHRRYAAQDLRRIEQIDRLRKVQRFNLAAIRSILGVAPTARRGADGAGNRDLCRRLRALRAHRRLKLREVSRATGLATSFISSVERGLECPSVASLSKLARCYGTTISALSSTPRRSRGKVIRAGRYQSLPMLGAGVKVEQLAEGECSMECHRFTVSPGAGSEGEYAHEGEEFIHVLTGHFEILLDGRERCRLGPGDSAYFKSSLLHGWWNPGAETAQLLWINTPPTF